MEGTETNHPQELGKVGKGIWRILTVVHDLIAQQEAKSGISLPLPMALTSKYTIQCYEMFLVLMSPIY